MPRDLRAYLWDIEQAARDIHQFTLGKQRGDDQKDPMRRAAVERRFMVLGEALVQALRFFPEVATRITGYRQIVGFRNQLVHGYATVSDELVWDIVKTKLPVLAKEVKELLDEA